MSPLSGLARFFDAAKKDLESKSLSTVKDLIGSAPAPAKKEEAPVGETPAEAVVVEAPAETVVETAPESPVEVVATTEEKKEEVIA